MPVRIQGCRGSDDDDDDDDDETYLKPQMLR
jgi:hypothetical protein